MARKIKCPKWGCNGVGVPVDTKKKFSLGKTITGAALGTMVSGPIGGAIGSAMMGINGKNGKTTFVCNKCGKVFEKKV